MSHSTRLRADVGLYAARHGHLLRVGTQHHRVHLDAEDAAALLDALLDGGAPRSPAARAALDSLVAAGLADPAPLRLSVLGNGDLACAVRAAHLRMGGTIDASGMPVVVAEDDAHLPDHGRACWRHEGVVVLSPPAVSPSDTAARRRAAMRHRDADQELRPLRGGRRVDGAPSAAGLELAASIVVAELMRAGRAPYEAVLIDLADLRVTRHPVLPCPPAPR